MSVQEAADNIEPVETVNEVNKETALFADSNEANFQDSLQSAGMIVFHPI